MSDTERAAKRQKRSMPELSINITTKPAPSMVVDVCADGDTVLVVKGLGGVSEPVGIRVSSTALRISSAVFRRLLASEDGGAPPTPSTGEEEPRTIHVEHDDGDALLLLLNILHLRNDALPARLPPDLLFRFVATCARYECIVAAGRAASQWLDYIYTKSAKASKLFNHTSSSAPPATPASAATPNTPFSAFPPTSDSQTLFKLIEVSLLLNDALYFARFTSHFILTQPTLTSLAFLAPAQPQHHLAATLQARQSQVLQDLRIDLDLLVDPLAEAMSEETKHHHDCAPGDEPNPNDEPDPPPVCSIDRDGATEFLSALRDANLWPATRWRALTPSSSSSTSSTVGAVVSTLETFRVPDYDPSDACYWCSHVEDRFATALNLVRAMHKDRLWGLCLDCYKAGGTHVGECRYEHFKAAVAVPSRGVTVAGGNSGIQAASGNPTASGVPAAGSGVGAGSANSMAAGATSTQG